MLDLYAGLQVWPNNGQPAGLQIESRDHPDDGRHQAALDGNVDANAAGAMDGVWYHHRYHHLPVVERRRPSSQVAANRIWNEFKSTSRIRGRRGLQNLHRGFESRTRLQVCEFNPLAANQSRSQSRQPLSPWSSLDSIPRLAESIGPQCAKPRRRASRRSMTSPSILC